MGYWLEFHQPFGTRKIRVGFALGVGILKGKDAFMSMTDFKDVSENYLTFDSVFMSLKTGSR